MIELPLDFSYNGKIFRYGPKEKLWAVGYEWVYKSNSYRLVHYGDWSQGDKNTWKSYEEKDQTPTFKKKEKEALEEIKLSLDIEKEKKNKECAELWSSEWAKIPDPHYNHSYIESKGLSDPHGTKIDVNGALIIKIVDKSGIVGVQKIFKTNEGYIKRFSTGIKKKGSFGFIGDYQSSEYIYLAEGFATAASIYEATNIPVIIGIDSGNLFSAIKTIREINHKSKIIICADVDKNNVGIKSANNCKNFYLNVIVKTPKFTLKSDNQTDFNDLMISEGIESLSEQLQFSDNDFTKVTPLGYSGDQYFYTSSINSQVVQISSSGHVDKNLYRLAPHEYWKKIFSDDDKVIWPMVASQLMGKCHDKGIFNPDKVRGRGAWIDNDKFIINDGKSAPMESSYHYQKLIQINYHSNKSYDDKEMKDLLSAFQKLIYKNHYDYIYLASWLIQAQIFACLPWRFHLWLTGEKGSGKSHIIKWLHNSIPLAVLTNNATVAGIRQEIQNDATPICYDETEPDSGRMDGIIELARQMSSNDGAKTLRGTSGGKAVNLNTQCIFMFGSIQVQKLNAADTSRIFIVEMASAESQPEEDFKYIQDQFYIASQNKDRLFTRAFECLPSIIKSIEIVRKNILGKKLEARLADQLATLLACYHVYYSMESMTDDECDMYLMDYDLIKSQYVKDNEEGDSEQCYRDLMCIEVDNMCNTIGGTIGKIQRSAFPNGKDSEIFHRILNSYNLRFFPEDSSLFVPSKNNKLIKSMKNFPDLCNILKRDRKICVKEKATCRIPDIGVIKGIFIKIGKNCN